MANFDLIHGLTPFEKSEFFDFLISIFYWIEQCFFVLEYRKKHFSALNCLKEIDGEVVNCWSKAQADRFGRCFDVSTFWTCCFCRLERRFFVLEYGEKHFPSQYCLKKKMEKWPIFEHNHWLINPFGNISLFGVFD